MFGRDQPRFHVGAELLDGHPTLRRKHNLEYIPHRELRDCLAVARQYGLERFAVLQIRLLVCKRANTIQAKDDLRIQRMLDPQRAVLVELSDPLSLRQEIWATLCGGCFDELDDS